MSRCRNKSHRTKYLINVAFLSVWKNFGLWQSDVAMQPAAACRAGPAGRMPPRSPMADAAFAEQLLAISPTPGAAF
jgi:hypothetical protein